LDTTSFRITRQGVRWRFGRIFNDMYVSAFETILFIESVFGAELRDHAIRISKERHELRRKWHASGMSSAETLLDRRQTPESAPSNRDRQM
jgi:hypothetical protein